MQKNILKSLVKKISCIIKGVSAGEGSYISPRADIRYSERIKLGDDVVLEPHARIIANGKDALVSIGSSTTIFPYVLIKTNGGKISIGSRCSVNDYSILYGHGGIVIDDDVHIAAHTVIVASEHDYMKLGTDKFSIDVKGRGITIGKSVWIGANVVILDGVTIGTGSVIGAGAVVTKNIPPLSVAVGVPAKVIKKRMTG